MMDLLEEKQPDTSDIVGVLYSHIMLAVLDKFRPNEVPPTVDSINIQLVIPFLGMWVCLNSVPRPTCGR